MIRNFVSALFHELGDQAPAALAALLDQWSEQRRHAAHAGMRQVPAEPPRVSLLLPRDDSRWPPDSWEHLLALIVDARNNDKPILCAWGAHGVHGMAKRVQDYAKVNRAALIHAKQRAAQNDHDEIEKAADDLLERLDKKRG